MISLPVVNADHDTEQEFFDAVLEERELKRATRAGSYGAAANQKDRGRLKANSDADRTLGDPTDAVAFLRIDTRDDSLYVGMHGLADQWNDRVVYNWQAAPILLLQGATPDNPGDVTRHRRFRTSPVNQIESIDDLVFAELAQRIAELDRGEVGIYELDEILQNTLSQGRTPEMRQIVETIQAAQSRLIGADLGQLLVIQGGPGTGKTAVALHRVSAILFNHRGEVSPTDVLIVGPNPTFTRYIARVLPELGDENVRETDIDRLMDAAVSVNVKEQADAGRLKGDARMVELISRGLLQRIRPPQGPVEFSFDDAHWRVSLGEAEITEILESLQSETYAAGRTKARAIFEAAVAREARHVARADGSRLGRGNQVKPKAAEIDALLERTWPQLTPQAFLRDLFGSVERLLAAASGVLAADEVQLLRRQQAPRLSEQLWSKEDLPLLDQVSYEISGAPEGFAHIVVDEAQDLSPMQLQSLRRRSRTGSMTVVGDIAQSTGRWARDTWTDVVEELRSPLPVHVETLEYGYRVPRSVMDLARRLLSPGLDAATAPTVIRDVERDPQLVEVAPESIAARVVEIVGQHSGKGLFVGVICPDESRAEIEAGFVAGDLNWNNADSGGLSAAINLVSPVSAKGLEFDAVVVVDPQRIITAGPQGERMLYIAMTRTTRFLDVVYRPGELPTLLRDATSGKTLETPAPEVVVVELPTAELVPATEPADVTPRLSVPVGPVPAGEMRRRPQQVPSVDSPASTARRHAVAFSVSQVTALLEEIAPEHLWAEVLDEARRQILGEDEPGGDEAPSELD